MNNKSPASVAKKVTSVAAGGVFAVGLMASPVQADSWAADEEVNVSTTEILVTYDEEILTVGEGEDVESVDDYLLDEYGTTDYEAYLEDGGEDSGARPMGTGWGYLTNGDLRIISNCSTASIDFFKTGGSQISAEFRVSYLISGGAYSAWSPVQQITAGNRSGWTFNHNHTPPNVRGEMRVGSSIFETRSTSRC